MKLTLCVGLLFAASRVYIGENFEPDAFSWLQAYKDAAHLFMGGLFAAWYIQRHSWQWKLFWALNVVEVAVAVASRS